MRLLLVLSVMLLTVSGDTTPSKQDYERAMTWLHKAGYLESQQERHDSMSVMELYALIREPLRAMKKFYKLGDNGDLDVSTVLFMKKPRCGNRDRKTPVRASTDTKDKTSTPEDYDVIVPAVANNGSQSEEHQLTRRKRWDLIDGSAFWTSAFGFEMPITVGFLDYSSKMSQADQDAALVHCLTLWSQVSGVSFRLVPGGGKANNIYITFLARLPDDPDGNILARALPPSPGENTGSDIEFDSREPWVPKWTPAFTGESLSFQETLCHEIGHTLGLAHSRDVKAIMFADTVQRGGEATLNSDDIAGIQSVYGGPNGLTIVSRPAPAIPVPVPAPVPGPMSTPMPAPSIPNQDPRGVVELAAPPPLVTLTPRGGGGGARIEARKKCGGITNRRRRKRCMKKELRKLRFDLK